MSGQSNSNPTIESLVKSVKKLKREIKDLEKRFSSIEQQSTANPERIEAQRRTPQTVAQSKPARQSQSPPVISQPNSSIILAELVEKSDSRSSAQFVQTQFSTRQQEPIPYIQGRQKLESIESIIGGKVLNWAGGILLILSSAFFVGWLWHTFEFSNLAKSALIHAIGLALLPCAAYLHRKQLPHQASAIFGVALFVLYSAGLISTHILKVGGETSQLLGFVEGILITILAVTVAIRYRSMAIIIVSAIAGYLLPILIYGVSPESLLVLAYLTFLNIVVIASSHVERWSFLRLLAIPPTVAYLAIALANGFLYSELSAWPIFIVMIVQLVLFQFSARVFVLRKQSNMVDQIVTISSGLLFFLGNMLFFKFDAPSLFVVSGFLAAAYAIVYLLLDWKVGASDLLPRCYLALSSVFVTSSIIYGFGPQSSALATGLAGGGFVFCALAAFYCDRQLTITGLILFMLALLRWATHDGWLIDNSLFNELVSIPFVTLLGIACSMGMAGVCYCLRTKFGPDKSQKTPTDLPALLLIGANFLAMASMLFQFENLLFVSSIWMIDLAAIGLFGYLFGNDLARRACGAQMIFPLIAIGIVILPNLADNPGWTAFDTILVTISATLVGAIGIAGKRPGVDSNLKMDQSLADLALTIATGLFMTAITLQVHCFFVYPESENSGVALLDVFKLPMAELALISIEWGIIATSLVSLGLYFRLPVLRSLGLAIFGLVVLKILALDLAQSDLIIRVFALSIVGILLVGVSILYQKRILKFGAANLDGAPNSAIHSTSIHSRK